MNNLGGTPLMELYIVAHNAVQALRNDHGLDATRIMVKQRAITLTTFHESISLSNCSLVINTYSTFTVSPFLFPL